MPDFLHGRASFPGITSVKSCSYTCSHGITPGMAELLIAPQAEVAAEVGDLEISDGNYTFTIKDCKVDKASITKDSGGTIIRFAIMDRRWKWRFGSISGSYNAIDDGDKIIPFRRKTLKELVELCFLEMGETGFSTAGLPAGDIYPTVEWDHANPAESLTALVEQFGCRVVYNVETNSVYIQKLGDGKELPIDNTITSPGLSIDPPEKPDKILFVAGKSKYQCRLSLEAVGQDTDGTIKAINDLSYKPTAGWHNSPPDFGAVKSQFNREAWELAKNTVFRWFRVTNVDATDWAVERSGTKLNVPLYGKINRIEQIELDDKQVNTAAEEMTDEDLGQFLALGGVLESLPPEVTGKFWDPMATTGRKANQTNTALGDIFGGEIDIDKERRIVKFSEYMIRYDPGTVGASNTMVAPILFLDIGVFVRDPDTWAFERFEKELDMPPPLFGTKDKVVRNDDHAFLVRATYAADGRIASTENNAPSINAVADYYLAGAKAEYDTKFPQEIAYAGLRPIFCDGAIHQVTWSIGPPGGSTTHASRNTEYHVWLPTYAERRRWERLRKHLDLVDRIQKNIEEVFG